MSLRRFLLVASIGSLAAATLMVLATVLDVPILYAPALLAILGIFAAREAWLWEGDRRGLLVMMGAILGVVAIAFLVQRVLG
ncbi:MAG TPA: hypothetical protein VEX36_06580 [Thermoleophilaceae bacterium]|nr:hypothetical protein [Thermoleophilaceae bacterium]